MNRKVISGIALALLSIGMLTLAFSIQSVKAATVALDSPSTIELSYDDGTSEVGPAWNVAGGMFAVQFTAPFYPAKVLEARVFFHALNNPSDPIRVHILDDEFNDLTAPIELTVYQAQEKTWLAVDVSSRDIVLLSGDFFVASEQLVGGDPDIGSDRSSPPQGRSWEFNRATWYPQLGTNYMIRVLIEPCPQLIARGWGKMWANDGMFVRGPAELYMLGERAFELVIFTGDGGDHSRIWMIAEHYFCSVFEVFDCYDDSGAFLKVTINHQLGCVQTYVSARFNGRLVDG